MTVTFLGALVFACVLWGVQSVRDGIQGNNLKTAAIGAAFVIVGLLLTLVKF